jgi:hypothetical protein
MKKVSLKKKILLQQTECFLPLQFRNGIPRVCFYFCYTEWNSELFSLPRNGFGTEFQVFASIFVPWYRIPSIFSYAKRFGTEFRQFSVPRNSRNSAGINHLFRLFRLPRNTFLSEITNPSLEDGGIGINKNCCLVCRHINDSSRFAKCRSNCLRT